MLQACLRPTWSGGLAAIRRNFTLAVPSAVDVTIAGAGPTGITAGVLLAQHGVSSIVLERSATLTVHPQAHYINNRTMESLSPPLSEWRRFKYVDKLIHGQVLGDVDHFKGDGAGSLLREQLGAQLEGQAALQTLISVHFSSKQLASALQRDPAMLYFVYARSTVLVIVAHDLSSGDFVAQIPFFPPVQHPADFSEAACRRLLDAAAGVQLQDTRIHTIRPWSMHAQVADRFRVGNIFLAGDAAHRFPPAGGFGMNTGIQDAHNLAWKIAAALQKHPAPPAAGAGNFGGFRGLRPGKRGDLSAAEVEELLQSYEAERRPAAVANTALSIANWEETLKVPAAIGLPPDAAWTLQVASAQLPSAAADSTARRAAAAVLDASLRTAYAAAGLHGPFAAWRRAQLREIFDAGTTLQLQFPAEDLGFTYPSMAAHARSSQRPESIGAAVERIKGRRRAAAARAKHAARTNAAQGSGRSTASTDRSTGPVAADGFEPRFVVGGRLPHFELRMHDASADAVPAAWPGGAAALAAGAAVDAPGRVAMAQDGSVVVSSIDLPSMCHDRELCLVYGGDDNAGASFAANASSAPGTDAPDRSALTRLLAAAEEAGATIVLVSGCSGGDGGRSVAREASWREDGARMALDKRQLDAFAEEHGAAAVWFASDVSGQLSALAGGQALGVLVRPDGHIRQLWALHSGA